MKDSDAAFKFWWEENGKHYDSRYSLRDVCAYAFEAGWVTKRSVAHMFDFHEVAKDFFGVDSPLCKLMQRQNLERAIFRDKHAAEMLLVDTQMRQLILDIFGPDISVEQVLAKMVDKASSRR